MDGKNIAYIRVSTEEQNEARQLEAMKKCEIHKVFMDKASAKSTDRPKFKEMLDYVREGDIIYITDFSRLSRSTADLLSTLKLLEEKGVKVISLKENLDTSTPQGKLMLTVIGAINQFEREIMLERQREGIAIAKREGRYKGRKPIEKPRNWDIVMADYYKRRITATKAMQLLGLKTSTFYKFLNAEKIDDDREIEL